MFSGTIIPQFNNIQISSSDADRPEEVTIAINPNNPVEIAAGANINYFFSHSEEIKGWTQKRLSSDLGVWGDPCVVYDTKNNLYFAHLSNPVDGYWIDRIVVQKSDDNGDTWNNGAGVGYNYPKNQDKEWLAVDHSKSEYRNNIYMAWTEFDDYGSLDGKDSSRIQFSFSNDEGETWSSPKKISDVEGNCIDEDDTVEGAVPAVGPNGEIYVAWAGPLGLMFDKSLDGGNTFGKDIFISDIPGGWAFNVPGISRCNGMPITACDISNSEYRGNVYVGWSDQRSGTDNTDIFFIKSTDGGETWEKTLKVNDDNTSRHQFFTWMTVDSTNGNIYFLFYDRRNTANNETDVFIARSTDGGESFQNYKISESSFIPNPNIFFGDYTNIAAYNGIIRPIWMRMDNNSLSIWTAEIRDSELDITNVEKNQFEVKEYNLYQNYPNPFNPSTIVSYSIPNQTYVTINVFDILGNRITTLFEGSREPGIYEVEYNSENSLSTGIYYYQIITPEFSQTNKMMLLK